MPILQVDLITNSQAYEPAGHSNFYKGVSTGTLHRGMLNAYSRVSSGDITQLNEEDTSAFGSHIKAVYDTCVRRRNATSTSLHTFTCSVANMNLAWILTEASISALRTGKDLIVTGHSLGASLAFMHTINLVLNNHDRINADRAPKITSRRASKKKRDVIELIKHLHLYNFGEPEFADDLFFHAALNSSAELADLFAHRYSKFVSLTRAPLCKADIITRLTSKIEAYVGMLSSGRNKIDLSLTEGFDGPHVIYVSSGSAESSFDAHGMSHYLRGLAHIGRLHSVSSKAEKSDIKKIAKVDNKNRRRKPSSGLSFSFDIEMETAKLHDLIPIDDCFIIDEFGFGAYVC